MRGRRSCESQQRSCASTERLTGRSSSIARRVVAMCYRSIWIHALARHGDLALLLVALHLCPPFGGRTVAAPTSSFGTVKFGGVVSRTTTSGPTRWRASYETSGGAYGPSGAKTIASDK
jgi:hypothetical protein